MPGCEPSVPGKKVEQMSKQDEIFHRCEKLVKVSKRASAENKPGSCARCHYHRPDFKYRLCQFTRCPYGQKDDVFRKKPLKRDKFS